MMMMILSTSRVPVLCPTRPFPNIFNQNDREITLFVGLNKESKPAEPWKRDHLRLWRIPNSG